MSRPDEMHAAQAILLDIEGTTTPVDFVYQVLFPYARARVQDYLARHGATPEAAAILTDLRAEHTEDVIRGNDPPPLAAKPESATLASVAAYLHWLMDQDRKSTPLKSLQGLIWEEGYRAGELRGQVFDDVPPALAAWREQGKEIYIYSSGSVLAQKLLFAHTTAGDLTGYIKGYFDTHTGAKREPDSYTRIAAAMRRLPLEILFISDVTGELDAAQASGMQTALCVRPGNAPQAVTAGHRVIHTFDDMFAR